MYPTSVFLYCKWSIVPVFSTFKANELYILHISVFPDLADRKSIDISHSRLLWMMHNVAPFHYVNIICLSLYHVLLSIYNPKVKNSNHISMNNIWSSRRFKNKKIDCFIISSPNEFDQNTVSINWHIQRISHVNFNNFVIFCCVIFRENFKTTLNREN